MNDKKQFRTAEWTYFVPGLLVGFLVFLCIYGFGYLNVTNVDWIYNNNYWSFDFSQHYNGWLFFRDADWKFPFGLIDSVSYPRYTSIFFLDSIPLFALISKLLSGILPEHFQYMGIFAFLCFGLQGGMGSLIGRRFTDSRLACLLSGGLFALTPVMLQRVFIHTGLCAQFLVLLAIYWWLKLDAFDWKMYVRFALLGFLCVWTQMYFVPMCGIVLLAYVIDQILLSKKDRLKCVLKSVLLVIAYCGSALLALWMFGGFYGTVTPSDEGLGTYSANLNTLFNSMGVSRFLPGLPVHDGQYEGFSYPGLGVYVLFVVILVVWLYRKMKEVEVSQEAVEATTTEQNVKTEQDTSSEQETVIKEKKGGFRKFILGKHILASAWIVGIAFLMSILPDIYIGGVKIMSVPLPGILGKLLGIFRSSGRFMWLVVYLIMLLGLYGLTKVISKKQWLAIALALCVVLQAVDLYPILSYRGIEAITGSTYNHSYDAIIDNYERIDFLAETLGRKRGMFVDIAANHGLKLSESYISRQDVVAEQAYREELKEALINGQGDDRALYVMHNMIYDTDYNLHTYMIGDTAVGTTQPIVGLEEYKPEDHEFFYYNLGETGMTDCYDKTLVGGTMTYGESIAFDAGKYTLTLKGDNMEHVVLYVVHGSAVLNNVEEIEETQLIEQDENMCKVSFTLSEDDPHVYIGFANADSENAWVDRMYLEVEPLK